MGIGFNVNATGPSEYARAVPPAACPAVLFRPRPRFGAHIQVIRRPLSPLRLGMAVFALGAGLAGSPARTAAAPDPTGLPDPFAAPIAERPDAPAVLVRLRPAPSSPEARLHGRLREAGVASAVRAVEDPLGALLAGDAWIRGGEDEPLARVRRLVLEPGADASAVARALAGEPDIEAAWVEARYRVTWTGPPADRPAAVAGTSPFPNDPLFRDGSQWGLENTGTGRFGGVAGIDIRARAGWAITTGSTATIVGIVDTGVDPTHPDLGGLLFDGTPRIFKMYNSSVEPAGASAWDSIGHGTMVAGVALARTNNGPVLDGRGVAGVAGGAGGDSAGCRVIAVKATPTRYNDALSSELAEGIVYAVLNGARAVNLSFGGDNDDDLMVDAVSFAERRGCVVVCGAGNGQDSRPQYPGYYALYGNGLSIAGLRSDGTLALFSTRGTQIDVAAPAQDIFSIYPTYENAYQGRSRNFEYTSGTSFAAPFVTGLAGLAMTLQPSLTDNEFQQLLRHTARDVGAPGRDDTYGWGIPDAGALLAYVAPPRAFARGIAYANDWSLVSTDSVTLSRTRLEIGDCNLDGRYLAERWEVRARVDLPPGMFLETPLGMARTHASRGWPAGPLLEYGLGHGEVVPGSASPTGFTLRAWVYHIDSGPQTCVPNPGPLGFIPVAPESVKFGWSAFGRLDAPPTVRITQPAADGAAWSVDVPETLRWEADDPDEVTAVEIAVSGNGGASWRRVALLTGAAAAAGAYPVAAACGTADGRSRVRVTALDAHDRSDQASDTRTLLPSRACLAGEDPDAEGRFALYPLAPNPARGSAILRYSLLGTGVVAGEPVMGRGVAVAAGSPPGSTPEITIHDARGRRLRTFRLAGDEPGTLTWDGRDDAGRAVPSGVYFARLVAAGRSAGRRFVLLAP